MRLEIYFEISKSLWEIWDKGDEKAGFVPERVHLYEAHERVTPFTISKEPPTAGKFCMYLSPTGEDNAIGESVYRLFASRPGAEFIAGKFALEQIRFNHDHIPLRRNSFGILAG